MITATIVGDDGASVTLKQTWSGTRVPAVFLQGDWIEGWYSSPDAKVSSTARKTGHGNFGHRSSDILYESRTVTIPVTVCGEERSQVIAKANEISRTLAQMVTLTVADEGQTTWARGYCQVTFDSTWSGLAMTGKISIVCDDPRRYGAKHTGTMRASISRGGLQYASSESDDSRALAFPISFGDVSGTTTVLMDNQGTATAYPTIEVYNMTNFSVTDLSTGDQVSYQGWAGSQPLIIDCLRRTASINGVDQTRNLTRRSFPACPPGGTCALALDGTGGGYAAVTWYDTYI